MSINTVKIFDTTLRDGEQAPGFSMTSGQKLRMAEALEALKVDVMEAGFAAASIFDLYKEIKIPVDALGTMDVAVIITPTFNRAQGSDQCARYIM